MIPLQYSDRFCRYLLWIRNIPIDYVAICNDPASLGAVRWCLFAVKSYGSPVIPLQCSDRFCRYLVWIRNVPIDYVAICSDPVSLGVVRWCLFALKVTDLQ